MKIVVDVSKLKEAVRKLQGLKPACRTRPILLGHTLLIAKEGYLKLWGTNLEAYLELLVEAEVFIPGEETINMKELHQCLKDCTEERAVLESVEGKKVRFRAGTFVRVFVESDPVVLHEYTIYTMLNESQVYSIETAPLLRAVKLVGHSFTMDESKPSLMCILVKCERGLMKLISTDSRRLSVSDTFSVPSFQCMTRASDCFFLITGKDAVNLMPVLADSEKIQMLFQKKSNLVGFHTLNTSLVLRIQEGEFPDYAGAIPEIPTHARLVTNTKAFLKALQPLEAAAKENAYIINLDFCNGGFLLASVKSSAGEGQAVVPGDFRLLTPLIDEYHIGINLKYLQGMLKASDTKEITVGFCKPLTPILFTSNDPGRDFKGIVMPIRLVQ